MEYLPYGEFSWIEDVKHLDFMAVAHESDEGYMIQIDLEYPCEQYLQHQDFPFAAEHRMSPDQNFKIHVAWWIATNELGKNLYKLPNKVVFGKAMENIRKQMMVKLVRSLESRC